MSNNFSNKIKRKLNAFYSYFKRKKYFSIFISKENINDAIIQKKLISLVIPLWIYYDITNEIAIKMLGVIKMADKVPLASLIIVHICVTFFVYSVYKRFFNILYLSLTENVPVFANIFPKRRKQLTASATRRFDEYMQFNILLTPIIVGINFLVFKETFKLAEIYALIGITLILLALQKFNNGPVSTHKLFNVDAVYNSSGKIFNRNCNCLKKKGYLKTKKAKCSCKKYSLLRRFKDTEECFQARLHQAKECYTLSLK
jgi:hypothetical protein